MVPIPVLALAAWSHLSFTEENTKTHEVTPVYDVYADGHIVFGGSEEVAASVAQVPEPLLAEIEAWAKKGPARAPKGTPGEYLIHVQLVAHGERRATYDWEHLPPAEKSIADKLGALINTKRTPQPCPAWDGGGAFVLALYSQDFGVAAGPIRKLTIKSDGMARHETSGKLDAETKLAPPELAAVRAALKSADLGHFQSVFGGKGEGSNLRTVRLTWSGKSCARSFTNQLPAELKGLTDAIDPIAKRLTTAK